RKGPLGKGREGGRRQSRVVSPNGRLKHGAIDFFQRTPVARAALCGMESYVRDASHVDSGGRENKAGPDTLDQSFLAYHFLCDVTGPHDLSNPPPGANV